MNNTKSLIQSLDTNNKFPTLVFSGLNPLVSKVKSILDSWPDVVPNIPEKDREKLVIDVLKRLENNNWADTKLSLVIKAAWAAFDVERAARVDLDPLRQFYYDEIRVSSRTSFLNAFLNIYMESFLINAKNTRELASALIISQSRFGNRWKKIINMFPTIFDASNIPKVIAKKMLSMEMPWYELKQLGITNPHSPGLMTAAHLEYIKLCQPNLDSRVAIERFISWLKPEGKQAKLDYASEAIEAILGHWLERDPDEKDLTYITESLIDLYDDPRTKRSLIWNSVRREFQEILERWLTGENIRFFMDVVSAVEKSHMWEPRRRFWLGLHKQKRINSAWVAFCPRAVEEANKRSFENNSRGVLKYGKQTAGNSRGDTSLLILQIGNKIVVEGSHNYKVHIFERSNPKAPSLYQDKYDCEHIRLKGAEARAHDAHGYWEGWVLERI